MKQTFSFFFALLVSCLLAACGSDTDDAQPTTGTIQGQITPALSITTVVATDSLNRTITTTPTAGGTYTLQLPRGPYDLSFIPTADYTVPPGQFVYSLPGRTTDTSPTYVTRSGGTATLNVNGTATNIRLARATLSSKQLTLILQSTTNQLVILEIIGYNNASQTGILGSNPESHLSYTETERGGLDEWASQGSVTGSGTYSVLPAGGSSDRVSGSFSCTVQPANGSAATGTRTIEGTFTNVAY